MPCNDVILAMEIAEYFDYCTTAIALVLFNRAMAFHSGNILDPATAGEFTGVIGLVQDGLKPFLFIWLYEWWYIGRRRSELGFED